VVDEKGKETDRILRGDGLPHVLQNHADNSLGRIAFSAAWQPGATPASGDFTVATIRFRAISRTTQEGTPVAFLPEPISSSRPSSSTRQSAMAR